MKTGRKNNEWDIIWHIRPNIYIPKKDRLLSPASSDGRTQILRAEARSSPL